MKGHSQIINSAPATPRKARVVANHMGDPCVLVYPGKGSATVIIKARRGQSPLFYDLVAAKQLRDDLNEAIALLEEE